MPIHSEECLERAKKARDERTKWDATYPGFCRLCEGWGSQQFIQKHDEGPSEYMSEPCECIENSKCPRCGKETIEMVHYPDLKRGVYDWFKCTDCGWDEYELIENPTSDTEWVRPGIAQCSYQARQDEEAFEKHCQEMIKDAKLKLVPDIQQTLLIHISRSGFVRAYADEPVGIRVLVLDETAPMIPCIEEMEIGFGDEFGRFFEKFDLLD